MCVCSVCVCVFPHLNLLLHPQVLDLGFVQYFNRDLVPRYDVGRKFHWCWGCVYMVYIRCVCEDMVCV